MSTATAEKKYLKWYQKVAYGSGDLAANCSYGLVSSFILLYLTGTMGLNSGIIGTLMLASKFLDGISDVIFGTLIDRTHSKLGKARPWMLYGQIGLSVCLFLLFAVPAAGTTVQYIYFFVVYTALNAVFFTANNIAYASLVALITKNNNERVQLGSIRFMFAVVTNIVMGFAVTGMVEKFGGGAAGWRTTALIFAIIGLVVNTISCLAVKELPEDELADELAAKKTKNADDDKLSFGETVKILLHNKYYLLILAIYLVYYIMSNLTTGAGAFCATYYWGDGSLLGTFSMMKMFPVIIALALAPGLVKKFGSMQKVNFWGYLVSSVLGIPMIYFAAQKNVKMFLLLMFIKGIFAGMLSGSLNALIAEISSYTTRTTGKRMDGMMFSCSSLGVKVGGGIGTAAVGWLLELGGFVGTAAVQSESAITMIFNLYITFPVIMGVIITVLLAFLDVENANKKWDAEHKKETNA
ncbi:MFS transporter [uncultured Gemmiger sp.]|uniref:MFS transporter n=1 Tax=uncultured Gemmiger sp. TaxID=1623490 RepID=UPI0025D71CEE|nr:MFS transporter [uncultured Gemmiger sp.]